MGWTFVRMTRDQLIRELTATEDTERSRIEVIDHSLVGNVLWTVVRVTAKQAGVLGLGRIGFEVAKRLAGFNMDIAYSDISAKDYAPDWEFVADPVALAERSDFFFVTLAASAETRHIVDKDVIEAVGPEGVLINVSRASNVDEEALLDALESGKLGSAALDVFDNEPNINPRFLVLDNVLLQPHQASGTVETRKAMGQLMRDNLAAHFAGKELPTPVI